MGIFTGQDNPGTFNASGSCLTFHFTSDYSVNYPGWEAAVSCGCPAPEADFSYTPAELSVQFTDLSTNNPTSWSWDFGDGSASNSQSPQHSYSVSGTYYVCLTAVNECGQDIHCANVVISGAPEGLLMHTGTVYE
ncbi:MAG: PKD domain-containing protein, partial [FCB group bacterium]|nr:PKD domain-containing protein [FCB group bacterium]